MRIFKRVDLMKIRFFYRILKREGGKRGIIMEVNNHVKAGYMPGREKRASGSQGKDFSAKMSDVLAQKEEKQDGAAENPLRTAEEMMRFIRERKQEIYDKVRKGQTEVKIRIGAQEYTEKEWDKVIESFDEAEDDIRRQLQEAREQQRKAREKLAVREKEDAEEYQEEDLIEKLLSDREKDKEI